MEYRNSIFVLNRHLVIFDILEMKFAKAFPTSHKRVYINAYFIKLLPYTEMS